MQATPNSIPNHLAIIMDGNGRWAKKRMMPRVYGHRKGVERLKEIVMRCHQLKIKVLTVYAFSTENWARPKDEVNYLMKLPESFFKDFMPQMMENQVKITVIGQVEALPAETQAMMREALEKTKDNQGLILNIALNYGGRDEILQAVQSISRCVANQQLKVDEIDQTLIDQHLMTGFLGDLAQPDLMIRTSGELRLSNFLLWQLAYSEFYFTDVLWPDFTAEELDKAIESYAKRQRRYGKV